MKGSRFVALLCLDFLLDQNWAWISRPWPSFRLPHQRCHPLRLHVAKDGRVGSGPNWIERSFPLDVTEDKKVDPKKVEDYNLGISGVSLQTGPLSARMFEAIVSRSSINRASEEIQRAYKLYAMDFTAKESVRAALKQNGLELALADDEEDEGMWSDIDTIRLLDSDGKSMATVYDSWEEAVDDWTPGIGFDFVARQVPARMRELSLDELLKALDPDGSLRQQAKDAGMRLPDEEIASLRDLADDNIRRVEAAPRGAVQDTFAFAGKLEERGYQPIRASDLLYDSMNADGTENQRTLIHVMNSFVSHGCLLVDLTDGGTTFAKAEKMAHLWDTARAFFDKTTDAELPGLTTAHETGSHHAKVGFASYDNGNLKFLETRLTRSGNLLPKEAHPFLTDEGCEILKDSFAIVAQVGKDAVRIAVAASTMEAGALNASDASDAATLLADELIDDGKRLRSDIVESKGSVSMSPHRLCRYSNNNNQSSNSTQEVFGAHTDSTFITAVPVASIAGLEVYDEETIQWYRPELAARQFWQREQETRGKDPAALTEVLEDGVVLPWHARYVVLMPGEMLQLVARNEIVASVHRVVATKDQEPRLSAPILLRGRIGCTLNADRYLGGTMGDSILEECNGMTTEQLHDAMQPSSFQ